MAQISDLPDALLVKILSYLPTKIAVSTSILSKQWEFLWMWLPNLEFDCTCGSVRDFINKNLPLHRAPFINRLHLSFGDGSSFQPENFNSWVEIAVSHALRELICDGNYSYEGPSFVLPNCLYTCNSLVTLKLEGEINLVDVPRMVCLPSLKTLKLINVTYSNEDSLRLLLSSCPVLEDLAIDLECADISLVIIIPSLQRLSLYMVALGSEDRYVIATPSLKYLEINDERSIFSYLIEHMPELEEADIWVQPNNDIEKLLKSIASVKRLSLNVTFNIGSVAMYPDGIVFSQLKELELSSYSENWSLILLKLLESSPNLQILHLKVVNLSDSYWEYRPISWSNNQISVPECLSKKLKTFTFKAIRLGEEHNDFLSFIFKHARRLKSSSISLQARYELEEAYIGVEPDNDIEKLRKSITSVKRLSLDVTFNIGSVAMYPDGIVFSQLKELELSSYSENWSLILLKLLESSPNLQILHLEVVNNSDSYWEYRPISWSNNQISVPECLSKKLQTFTFKGIRLGEEHNDFLSFIFKHARRLKSSSISL